jgi:hypothetical protein
MSDWLEGATRDPARVDGGLFTRRLSVGVVHSTESSGWPSYGAGDSSVHPHLTVSVLDREVRQHIPFDRAARALRNASGGVQTNRAGCVQLEVIGTCDYSLARDRGILYLPDLDDEQLLWLGQVLLQVCDATDVLPMTTVEWRDYNSGQKPSSYGSKNGVRLTPAQWLEAHGWVGHMHVPENLHGDPGSLRIDRALALALAPRQAPPAERPPAATQGAPVRDVAGRPEVLATQAAVRVKQDGKWGEQTEAALEVVHAATRGEFPAGVDVAQRIVGATPDGRWGPKSKAALARTVRLLQAAWNAGADGVWGPITQRAYEAAHARNYKKW